MNILQIFGLDQPAVRAILIIIAATLVSYALTQRSSGKLVAFLEKEINNRSDSISMLVATVQPDGTLQEDFSYNAQAPLPLASTIKIVILAAYAQEVTEGRLDPQEAVSILDWERYYLPGTDGGAHLAALESLSISSPTDNLGFASQDASVTLDDVVSAMMTHSDNAATDYVMKAVGQEAMVRISDEANLEAQDLPASFVGSILALMNHTQPTLQVYDLETMREAAAEHEELYLNDAAWREDVLAWYQDPQGDETSENFDEIVAAFQGFDRGSAADYAKIMAGVVSETFISPEASRIMQEKLEWPMRIPGNDVQFETFGGKGGSLPGIITEAMYVRTSSGDYSGENRIVVLFMTNLDEERYSNLAQSASHQEVTLALAKHTKALKPLLEAQQALE